MEILESHYLRYSAVALYEPLGFVLIPESRIREGLPRSYPLMQGFGETIILADPDAGEFVQVEKSRLQLRCEKPEETDCEVLQRVVAHLLGVLGATLTSVRVNHHYRFKVGGQALGVVRVLLDKEGETGATAMAGALVSGGVRLICDRPDGRYDLRVEALPPDRPADELLCGLTIRHETTELGNLMLRGGVERDYLMRTVGRLCESVAGGGSL
jgi:hypothetical protein